MSGKISYIEPRGDIDIFALNLTAEEGFVLSRLEKRMTLKELSLLTGFPEEKVTEIVRSLYEKGALIMEGLSRAKSDVERAPVISSGFSLSFQKDGLIDVFIRIRMDKLDGFLRVRRDSLWKMVFFMNGNPVYAVSNTPGELLGNLLVAARVLDREELEEYLKESEEKHVRLGELLVSKGVITRGILQNVLRKQVEIKILDLLKWEYGDAEFVQGKSFDIPFFYELSSADLLMKALKTSLTNEEISNFVEDKLNLYVYVSEEPPFSWGEFELDQKERILVEVIQERPRLLREVISLSPLMLLSTYRIITIFFKLRMITLKERRLKEENITIIRDKLRRKLDKLYNDNFFERLVLHESAIGEEVETAYKREKEIYNPINYPDDEEIKELLAKINRLIDEAYDVLRDTEQRKKYRKELFPANKLNFEASIQFEKGELELLREEFKEAYYLFRSAYELNPDVPEYGSAAAVTGYLFYRGIDDRMAESNLNQFKRFLSRFPSNEKILYHAFLLEKFRGNMQQAKQYLQKILAINPSNQDAKKALRKMSSG